MLEIILFIEQEDLSGVTHKWEIIIASDTSSRIQS